MMRVCLRVCLIVAAAVRWASAGWTQESGQGRGQPGGRGVDRLYILDCGQGHVADQSRWSPGVNVGKPYDISVNCYLIHDSQGYLLWDTGISDLVADMPKGWQAGSVATGLLWTRAKTLASQLKEIGVAPSDIRYVGVSHTHPDHIGNVEMFPSAIVLIQRSEYDYAFTPGNPPLQMPPTSAKPTFSPLHPVILIEEDLDVFGDGAATIIFTPGHTPGHQSLLVHLPKTGWVVLSGDAVHFRSNWENRRIPYFPTMPSEQKVQTLLSMQRIADLMASYHAQLWINHDKAESDKMRHAPEFYE
jgi:N-acyl homoserine lactone hydrolase